MEFYCSCITLQATVPQIMVCILDNQMMLKYHNAWATGGQHKRYQEVSEKDTNNGGDETGFTSSGGYLSFKSSINSQEKAIFWSDHS